MSERYESIETLFKRRSDNKLDFQTVRSDVWKDIRGWEITEKIDGMNMRVEVGFKGELTIKGRSDNASIPADLKVIITEMFAPHAADIWNNYGPVTVYGEGYGPGIKGSDAQQYLKKVKNFRAFDVNVDGRWLSPAAFWEFIGDNEILGTYPLGVTYDLPGEGEDGVEQWMEKFAGYSYVANGDRNMEGYTGGNPIRPEGVVARPLHSLTDEYGNRVMWKLCWRDLK